MYIQEEASSLRIAVDEALADKFVHIIFVAVICTMQLHFEYLDRHEIAWPAA